MYSLTLEELKADADADANYTISPTEFVLGVLIDCRTELEVDTLTVSTAQICGLFTLKVGCTY